MLIVTTFILIVSIALILLSNSWNYKKIPIIKEFYVLGTIVQLKVYGKNAEKAILEATKRLNDIDNKMSIFKDYSDISKINLNAGGDYQKISEDTYEVIKSTVKYCKLTNGTFDPTIKPTVSLWAIGTDKAKVPNKNEISSKLNFTNYRDILFNDEKKSVKLRYKNQGMDLGGIAKGYAADEIRDIFIKNKIKSAIIDLGGNIFALGKKEHSVPWKIGIQNPLKQRGEFVGTINVKNKSIVTSGNYERCSYINGKRFHHIIDPRTGYPSESTIISATIISDRSIDGDGLSTGVYIMGLEKAINLIESLNGIDAIFITKDNKIYVTSGIKQNFQLLNNDFMYEKTVS